LCQRSPIRPAGVLFSCTNNSQPACILSPEHAQNADFLSAQDFTTDTRYKLALSGVHINVRGI
jgi:hypothetical protein